MLQQTQGEQRPQKRDPQTDIIMRHLQTYGNITSMDAIEKYGITRLASVIFKLRAQGVEIITHREPVRDRYGSRQEIARYILIDPQPKAADSPPTE